MSFDVGGAAGNEKTTSFRPVSASICQLSLKEKSKPPSAQETKLAESFVNDGYVSGFIIVSPGKFGSYNVITNESILRAALIACIDSVPAIIGDFDKYMAEEVRHVDDVLKGAVCPVELAEFYSDQIKKGESERGYAKRNNIKPTTLRNKLRLLNLDNSVLQMVKKGKLSESQGRTIAYLKDPKSQMNVSKYCLDNNLSVRKLEQYIHQNVPLENLVVLKKDPDIKRLEIDMTERLGMTVTIAHEIDSGVVEVNYEYPSSALDIIKSVSRNEFTGYVVELIGSINKKGMLMMKMPDRDSALDSMKILSVFKTGVRGPGTVKFSYDDLDSFQVLLTRLYGTAS